MYVFVDVHISGHEACETIVFSSVLSCARLAPVTVLRNPQTSSRDLGVNIISKVVNPPNGCYAQRFNTHTLGYS